ncbi:helix-turn-helix transcriptional regulator [Ruegeria sp. 2205SS24-7]|uniref:helix-turn-helix transcriptional regulator n=1 Tax=Ruegeria discodermiae TaxID=3064389 RepID=UPI0027420E35|nr:helix-turn-helix transcriptional regulator [Ruegeria sp. 2205SS24-7]MDP5216892.1 helix-turn-helix transcriptional regulator [Ruegeria sp. 2205SS24-7]
MSIEILSIRQIKAARALLAWSQVDLAERSGVSYPTIARLETNDGPLGGRRETAIAIRSALEAQGIQFLDSGEVAAGPGVAMKP